ncbi:MAG: hypothetical protein RL670_576, partial [Actinomycetota bacterium]
KVSDLIFWGGGELLKDYTNKLSLWYWAFKLTVLRGANKNIFGFFQGIGPTKGALSQSLIAYTANRTRGFSVRDAESKEKLDAWGVRVPVVASYDPAVWCQAPTAAEGVRVAREYSAQIGLDASFFHDFAGFGIRRWFHYRPGGFLPAKMRFWRSSSRVSAKERAYIQQLADMADSIIELRDVNLVFFPMHVAASENDAAFANAVVAKMQHGWRTHVIVEDTLSPADFLALLGRSRFFVASRLHSAILATVAAVPAYCLYYVDKGRLFFEQLGLQEFSAKIDETLSPETAKEVTRSILKLTDISGVVRNVQVRGVQVMREAIYNDFFVLLAEKLAKPRSVSEELAARRLASMGAREKAAPTYFGKGEKQAKAKARAAAKTGGAAKSAKPAAKAAPAKAVTKGSTKPAAKSAKSTKK